MDAFIQTVFDFVIIGFCIFMVLKPMKKTKKTRSCVEASPAGPPRRIAYSN